MALEKLELSSLARDYFRNACRWMECSPGLSRHDRRDLAAFRHEAEALLGETKAGE